MDDPSSFSSIYRYLRFTKRQTEKVKEAIKIIEEILKDKEHEVTVSNIINWMGLVIPTITVRAKFKDEDELYNTWALIIKQIAEKLGVSTAKSIEIIVEEL